MALIRRPFLPSYRPLSTITSFPSPLLHRPYDESLEEEEEKELEAESITNRSYWTKRIHFLCSTAGDPDAALRLLHRLRLRGFVPDSLNLSSVIHSLCDVGRSDEAHRRLLLSTAAGWLPDDRTANVLLARLLDAATPSLTLAVLRRLADAKPAFAPSLTNYNRLADHLCSQGQPFEALGLLSDMKTRGRLPDAITYTTLINGFCRAGELHEARRLFDKMLKGGILPNSLTYSVLIKGVLRKRRLDEARELMMELWPKMEEEKDPSVNSAAFANLIDSLCREGFIHEVFRIAEEMPQGKSLPEEFAYGQMMDSLCRAGRHHGASRIVYIMRKRGFFPSLVSYNCIVHGLSKNRGCMRAYQLFKEGIEFGYSPSEPTYKVLVEALCKEMDLHKAKDVAEFMLQKDSVDKTRIYNIFLSALHLVDNPSEQLNVLISMLQKQCQPDAITLNTVIHGFCKIGKVAEAKKIMSDMLNGNFFGPDVVTFTTIIRGLLDVGNSEEALDMLQRTMPKCHCFPNVVTYNVVLCGLVKLQKVDKAMEIFNDMVSKGIAADSTTYTAIIEGLCNIDRLEEAKRFWDEIVWPSKIHDNYVYAAILRGLCHMGKLDQACDFLYELVDCGAAPGIVNYNILVDSACKQGVKKEAYQIMGEMRKNGLKPDAVTWRILEKLHEKQSKEPTFDSQSLECRGLKEETVMTGEFEDETILKIIDEEKECINKVENHGDPLEGLVDPSLSAKLVEEDKTSEADRVVNKIDLIGGTGREKPVQPDQREPLSKIAKRVFGIL
ncbi:pentatricopeptide repeat-containing protein At3g18020 [Phoenix dactylifera]|uniref:Pentatricopeptide repeat-containing protein At3g18020 n=1 Tax=Phoenix dactylifera TaxID=42345 RepID=A0A8B8J2J3_PHODC|nr:pentatricopeptide repeat-containing protein At3g18020 [Phoenix dactylifera]